MVDLSKVGGGRTKPAPLDPRKIFDRQPKPEGVNDLWESQGEVLRAWHERRGVRDIVIKLNTGGGKTLVGLLIAQSLMNEHGTGALYLCANNQLVDQTLLKAREFQFPVVRYESGAPLPPAFANGEATLIGTYRSLFHGYSKFQIKDRGVPVRASAIICDDAHTAFTDVRNAFSVVVSRAKSPELYRAITARFRDSAEKVNRLGTYDLRVGGQDAGVFEVPFWAWRDQAAGVRDLLLKNVEDSEYVYQLPLLLDGFDAAHVLVRASDVMITPFLPTVDLLPTFAECPHRVFMSATIADDSSLVRTFDADPESVREPIAPASLAGVGERMILVPALTPVGAHDELAITQKLCTRVVSRGYGVVILVPSESRAKRWSGVAKLAIRDEVAVAVESLTDRQRHDNGPYVFANRYDGVDLPKDACRLLIVDGLPQGASAYDEYRANILRGSSQIELGLAQRVEQGMGRGTRGAGDYCVVVLLGNVGDWVSRRSNVSLMTPATRAQLDVGLEVSKTVADADDFENAAALCLDRKAEWVRTHATELAERAEGVANTTPEVAGALSDAIVERRYFTRYSRADYEGAMQVAREAANEHSTDRLFRGWLLQMAARAAFYHYRGQAATSNELQKEAATANTGLLPPPGYSIAEPLPPVEGQANRLSALVESYAHREGYLASLAGARLALTGTVPAADFEQAMCVLGEHLGLSSDRLDRGSGQGPDNTWRTDDNRVFVISCKNERGAQRGHEKVLFKKDLAQLLIDTKWIEDQYPGLTLIPLVVHPTWVAAEGLPTNGIHALTLGMLSDMVAAVTAMASELALADLSARELEKLAGKLLTKHELTPNGLIGRYLRAFEGGPKPSKR